MHRQACTHRDEHTQTHAHSYTHTNTLVQAHREIHTLVHMHTHTSVTTPEPPVGAPPGGAPSAQPSEGSSSPNQGLSQPGPARHPQPRTAPQSAEPGPRLPWCLSTPPPFPQGPAAAHPGWGSRCRPGVGSPPEPHSPQESLRSAHLCVAVTPHSSPSTAREMPAVPGAF